MAMAVYDNISDTAYMIKRGCVFNTDVREKPDILTEISHTKKIYILTYVNKFCIVGCIDSGSDITIMQLNRYDQVFKSRHHIIPADIEHITTFIENIIPVLGVINTKFAYKKSSRHFHDNIHCPGHSKCPVIFTR